MKKHISAEYLYELGKGDTAKSDGFSENFQKKRGGHFQTKNLYRRFWTSIKGFFQMFSEKNAV